MAIENKAATTPLAPNSHLTAIAIAYVVAHDAISLLVIMNGRHFIIYHDDWPFQRYCRSTPFQSVLNYDDRLFMALFRNGVMKK